MKNTRNWVSSNASMIVLVVLIIAMMSGYIAVIIESEPDTMPLNTIPTYKSIENTGILGSARYYLFDSSGNRYHVTQDTFDSYKNLPRK